MKTSLTPPRIEVATTRDDERIRQSLDCVIMRHYEKRVVYPDWYGCDDALHHWSRAWEYHMVMKEIKGYQYAKVLDVGCGITFFPEYLAAAWDKRVVRVDYDPRVVAHLRGNAKHFRIFTDHMPVEHAAERGGDEAWNDFGAVLCISVLEHLDDPMQAIKDMFALIRPGGKLVCTVDFPVMSNLHESLNAALGVAYNGPPVYPRGMLTSRNSRYGLPGDMSLWKQAKSAFIRGHRLGHIPHLGVAMLVWEKGGGS